MTSPAPSGRAPGVSRATAARPPGAPTIRHVAEAAGVSTATVSRVLAGRPGITGATRERVLEAVRALGYRPSGVARALKGGTTQTLGLIVTDITNPFYPAAVRAIEDAAREAGFAVLLCNGDEDPAREAAYLELLAGRRVDGIIVASGNLTERHAAWLVRAPVPIVLVNCAIEDSHVPAVLSDNRAGARLAAEHLLALGHRRLGHIRGPDPSGATRERLAGVTDAVRAAGLPDDALTVVPGDGHVRGGERAMTELLAARPPITGVTCYNDLTAIGALRAARAAGVRVPEDVSVVGFDDIDLAGAVAPELTTLRQDVRAMGGWAVARIAREVEARRRPGGPGRPAGPGAAAGGADGGDEGPPIRRLPVRLTVRASSGPAPGAAGTSGAPRRRGAGSGG